MVNAPPCQVRAMPLHLTNMPSGSLEVTSSVSAHVPTLILTQSPSMSVPVTDLIMSVVSPVKSHLCPISPSTFIHPLKTTQTMSHEQPVDILVRYKHPQSAFIKEVDD